MRFRIRADKGGLVDVSADARWGVFLPTFAVPGHLTSMVELAQKVQLVQTFFFMRYACDS